MLASELRGLLDAMEPYVEKAAPRENLDDPEDYRNWLALAAARMAATAALSAAPVDGGEEREEVHNYLKFNPSMERRYAAAEAEWDRRSGTPSGARLRMAIDAALAAPSIASPR